MRRRDCCSSRARCPARRTARSACGARRSRARSKSMKLTVHDATGKEIETIDVDDEVFGSEPNKPVVHQALVTAQANKRAGTATTKTRGEVSYSTKKIRSQKGTGRSRQGSIGAPQHRHGGILFGRRPRS